MEHLLLCLLQIQVLTKTELVGASFTLPIIKNLVIKKAELVGASFTLLILQIHVLLVGLNVILWTECVDYI